MGKVARDGCSHGTGSDDAELSTLVIDHIVNNCNMQDLWAAVMIIEDIMARTWVVLPSASSM